MQQITQQPSVIRHTRAGKINIRSGNRVSLVLRATLWTLGALTVLAFFFFDYTGFRPLQAIPETLYNLQAMFLEPKLSHFGWGEAAMQVAITLGLGALATVFGAVFAFFLALGAAENLSVPWLSKSVRVVVAFVRAVPTVLWVLIFAIAAGLGSEAAVLGMLFHSVAYLVKAFSEAFEEVDPKILEALRSTGAGWWQTVVHGVLPSTFTYLLSWTFLRFEINFSVAVAMGAAAGAGGIGFELFMASGFYFDLREVGVITYMILAVAIVLEVFSTRLKSRVYSAD